MADVIPASYRAPLIGIRINNERARATPGIQPYRTLFVGSKISNALYGKVGTMTDGNVTQIFSKEDAGAKAGLGSDISEFARGFFRAESGQSLFAISISDASLVRRVDQVGISVSSNTKTIHAGVLKVYIGDQSYATNINALSQTDDIANADLAYAATNMKSLINADKNCPFIASGSGADFNLTAKNAGANPADYQIGVNLFPEDVTPDNVSFTLTENQIHGSGNITFPDLPTDPQYILVSSSEIGNSVLTKVATQLDDLNSAILKKDGHFLAAVRDILGKLTTKGNAFNSQFLSFVDYDDQSSRFYVSGLLCAATALAKVNDPGAGLTGLALPGITRFRDTYQRTLSEENTLLHNGIGTLRIVSGRYQVSRLITTYKTDPNGAADISYLDLDPLLLLSYLRFDLDSFLGTRFFGYKIGRVGVTYNSDQRITTTLSAKAAMVERARNWEERGLIQNANEFVESTEVSVNATDPNRFDINIYPDLVNQIKLMGVDIRFLL